MRQKRPDKHNNVLALARKLLANGQYRDTRHATERRQERLITLPEIKQIINGGWHEKDKDDYKEQWKAWNYSIRGKTIDRRELRIVVSFEDIGDVIMLIITTIDLDLS